MYAIIVHGGAGHWQGEKRRFALEGAQMGAQAGVAVLEEGGDALDAVVTAVAAMEDMPVFNAGTGSVLNADGEAEMDAGVMVGCGLRTGNVACLRRVRNPVLVARQVMEQTDHVLLVREGALRFARVAGFADYDPVTPERLAEWRERRRGEKAPGQVRGDLRHLGEAPGATVGAVALDHRGELAAATSTGGIALKRSGRVGDSPIPGAGNYATPACAASATGRGELMMRFLTTKTVCDKVAAGRPPREAVEEVLAMMAAVVGREAGVIALNRAGEMGIAHLTPAMVYAFGREGQEVAAAARADGSSA